MRGGGGGGGGGAVGCHCEAVEMVFCCTHKKQAGWSIAVEGIEYRQSASAGSVSCWTNCRGGFLAWLD